MFQQFQPSLFPLPPRRRSRAEREVVPQHPRRCGRWAEALTPGHLKLRRDGATHAEHADRHHSGGSDGPTALGNAHWTRARRGFAGLGRWAESLVMRFFDVLIAYGDVHETSGFLLGSNVDVFKDVPQNSP